MLNNSLQIANLSSSLGPTFGDCMRRETSMNLLDSVPVLSASEMPENNDAWTPYKESGNDMVLLKDATVAPMIHFVEKFLTVNKISNEDVNFLYNNRISRNPGDALINGLVVTEGNIRCANGFIHIVEDVILPLDNMAELINKKSTTKKFSSIIERFSAPYPCNTEIRDNYNREFNTYVDTVYQKRYYSERSQNNNPINTMPWGRAVDGKLKFDPGWNRYFSTTTASTTQAQALQRNMAVMLVPSDAAIDEWWNSGSGIVLKDYYKDLDSVPLKVIAELVNNNMLNSLIGSVPSKFETILNDGNNPMGITVNDVDSVYLACNGAIYLTNTVFNPCSYVSVTFPSLINDVMSIFDWAIKQCDYTPYLNSMDAYYSLFVPTNKGLLTYIDPVSYGVTQTRIFKFRYDKSAIDDTRKVRAGIYKYDIASGEVTDSLADASFYQITNRLKDVLENHIVIDDVESGFPYYRTKNGGMIRVYNASQGKNGMTVEGTMQKDMGTSVPVFDVYDQSLTGNGKTYILDEGAILTTPKTALDILFENEEFSEFYELFYSSGLLETKRNDKYPCGGENISLLNNFHYTVYAPTNSSIQELYKTGKLPRWEDIELAEKNDPEEADRLKEIITDFVKYHIQDNSIYIGQNPYNINGDYETGLINKDTGKFYRLSVSFDESENNLTIKDQKGNIRRLTKTNENLYNLSAREYQYNGESSNLNSNLYVASFVVVHQIDGPLLHK